MLEIIYRIYEVADEKTAEANKWRILRLDADRIRENLMSKEARLISEKMKLEKQLAEVTATKLGDWIEDDDGLPRCSKCHKKIERTYLAGVLIYGSCMPFCPNCGTDMR